MQGAVVGPLSGAGCSRCCLSPADRDHHPPPRRPRLARNPWITLHFTSTSGSWLNLVEIFFGIIARQAIRRGTFGSVRELFGAIEAFIDGWNERGTESAAENGVPLPHRRDRRGRARVRRAALVALVRARHAVPRTMLRANVILVGPRGIEPRTRGLKDRGHGPVPLVAAGQANHRRGCAGRGACHGQSFRDSLGDRPSIVDRLGCFK